MITLNLIKSFHPCYDPKEIGFTSKMKLSPIEFIEQFKDKVKNKEDIIWLLARKEFMSERDQRLFSVWCAREALKRIESPDERSVNACNVSERYANGKASQEELDAARAAAWAAAWDAAMDAVRDASWAAARAAWAAARYAARAAAWAAAWDAAMDAVRDAVRDASWAAARAARYAARDAARDAAWDAQIEKLKEYLI